MSDPRCTGSALAAGSLGFVGAWLLARLLAAVVALLSVDQPLQAEAVLTWGGRWAWLLAVAMACGAALGRRPPLALRRVLANTGLLLLGVLLAALAAMAAGFVLVRLGLWGQHWGLPARSGHAAGIAALALLHGIGPPAAALGGWRLFTGRCRSLDG